MTLRLIKICLLSSLSFSSLAAEWETQPDGSYLGFTAEQQGAPFDGVFKQFSTEIRFDPADPESGHIRTVVDIASVNTNSSDRDGQLVTSDWFHVEKWPQALFETESIRAEGDEFVATAKLTIRDQTQPIVFEFRFNFVPSSDGHQATLAGRSEIKRLDFGLGQGDWSSTEWIADEVTVHTELALTRKPEL